MGKSIGVRFAIPVMIAISCLPGCSPFRLPESFPVQRQLIRRIKGTCSAGKPCTVKMRDVTDFGWDRMYVFAVGVTPAERKRIVGADGVETSDLEAELVFTKDGKIVHQEPVPEGVEDPIRNEVWFSGFENTAQTASYSAEVAFSITQSTSSNGPYFCLTPTH